MRLTWLEETQEEFRDLDLTQLNVDQALVNITSKFPVPLWSYTASAECHRCHFARNQEIFRNDELLLEVDTKFHLLWRFYKRNLGRYTDSTNASDFICQVSPDVGEFGVYDIVIDSAGNCNVHTAHEPVNIYWPLLLYMFIIINLLVIFMGARWGYKRFCTKRPPPRPASSSCSTEARGKRHRHRLRSLDTFRGIITVVMIFVNNGGGSYWFMEHSIWNGLLVPDLIFPSFLWIMGVSIALSVNSLITQKVSKANILLQILKRSMIMFFLGLFLNTIYGAQFKTLRIMGILQRLGICYLIVASLHTIFRRSDIVTPPNPLRGPYQDMLLLLPEWCIMLTLVILYLAVSFFLPVPGCGSGYLGPGGRHDYGKFRDCPGGATGYIDKLILGENHISEYASTTAVYESKPIDSENLFGTVLSVVHAFLGVQCGMTLLVYNHWRAKVQRWMLWGVTAGLLGGLLCGFSRDEGWIPINQVMWSLSYVLVTTSFAYLTFSLLYVLVDVPVVAKRLGWGGGPFYFVGMNTILIFIGDEICHSMLPFHWRLGRMNTHFMLLLENGWTTFIWILIALILYRKKWFFIV
ncbi:heparan-alpha-glucosaminide N-acetyltransferase-like [Phlebotomus argentipes]|uniref:heparan-alpha-glucosaminide N-acetyltransferase-like n=1 Tax=Phlebotomus argentipes TaxID=94469 RepID=UPI002892D38B|nr:heparan-alpha-glucosaminide N-acetyltransferase-like [Phlebotomus argentipes]